MGGQLFFGEKMLGSTIWEKMLGSTIFQGKFVGVNYFFGSFYVNFFFAIYCISSFDFCTPDSCLVFRSRPRSYFSFINIFPILDRFPRSHRAHVSCHIGAKTLSKRGIQGDNMYISRGKKHFI